MSGFDVIVLGVGTMGSAACFHLARRGERVLGLEQFGIPHCLGSHHGDTRMIRMCYYEHPDYVPLLRRAYALWQDLEQLANERLLHATGGLYMGHPAGEFIAGALRAAREHGLDHEQLTQSDVRERFPQFRLPADYIGVWEPRAGFLLPECCVKVHATLASRHGAQIHDHEPVQEWSITPNGVQVRTTRDTYSARHLVICGGAWSASILRDLAPPLRVTRQVLGWVQPRHPELFRFGVLPVWAIDHADGTQHYGFPMLEGEPFGGVRPGFKIAHHWHGPHTTAETIDRTARAEDECDFRAVLGEVIPDADGPLLEMAVCMYTCSSDSHFIIEPPRQGRPVTIACGFSGHGFKFASVMGEILADLATAGSTPHPIGFLSTDRFQRQSSPPAEATSDR
jgi:sarcosine oxidase